MRRDLLLILIIAAVACGVRIYPAWNGVFGDGRVNFLENDAWYHVRLVENQVHNYPWRVTLDPYAAPGGQFVPIAPLFDTITATAVVVIHGRGASTVDVERVAAFIPPLLGTLTVIAVWALARWLWDRGRDCLPRRCLRFCLVISWIAPCSGSSTITRSKRCSQSSRCFQLRGRFDLRLLNLRPRA